MAKSRTRIQLVRKAVDDGATLYEQICATCHEAGVERAPNRQALRAMSPERVQGSLACGPSGRDVRATEIYQGTSEAQRMIIAANVEARWTCRRRAPPSALSCCCFSPTVAAINCVNSNAMAPIFAMVPAPHCTGCTGDLHPLRTVIRRAGRVSLRARSSAPSTADGCFFPSCSWSVSSCSSQAAGLFGGFRDVSAGSTGISLTPETQLR
jgi:hypothetical protein